MPSNHLIFCCSLLLLPSIFPQIRVFPNESALHICGQRIGTSASVLPMNTQGRFSLGLTGLISLQSKDSQESSPTPHFKSISSSVLSLLYGPILTSIHDYWKNHSFDYMDLSSLRLNLIFIFLGSKIIAEVECNHELKRWVFLGREDRTNLANIL